ncbi:MAG: ABC transporter substrate-binding protein, partial [Solirubrobacteraceae bacterium]
MSSKPRRLELAAVRARSADHENHCIDELLAGRLDRREFLRRGATAGISASAMAAVLAACGGANSSPSSSAASSASSGSSGASSTAAPVQGGTLNLALQTPATAINPLLVDDSGGLCMLAQTGEFLTFDDNLTLKLEPMLATSWSHNGDGTAWTFKLRPGVKFHNGQALTADDVVYTFRQLADPKNASNALSTFTGVLLPAGVQKVDSLTVAFHLESAN